MGWLKGLVAPTAFGDSAQAPLPGMAPGGGPPIGGMPPPAPSPSPAPSYDASSLPSAMQWSTGTRTQGASSASGAGVSPLAATAVNAPASLEARCAQLQHDVDSLALFARTLLTMLEDAKVITRAQFDATKNRLDMLDGKLDDR